MNIAVDRYTDIGHDGLFPRAGEITRLLQTAGFHDARERYEEFTWDFPSWDVLVWFCRTLFRMYSATDDDVRREVARYLRVSEDGEQVRLHWSLVYASGTKGAKPS